MLKVQYQNYQEFILLKIKQLFLRENNAGLGPGYLYIRDSITKPLQL